MGTVARQRGFPPVIDSDIRVLILGSFPSPASLAKKQYYGHPQNHFWKLMGAVLDEPLYDMAYTQRLSALLKHGIGLWDVLHQCERAGALDSNIRSAVQNDFRKVTRKASGLKRVCFNGKTAGRFEPVFVDAGYETLVLPSSSPAYTLRFEAKLKAWHSVLAEDGYKKRARTNPDASAVLQVLQGGGFQPLNASDRGRDGHSRDGHKPRAVRSTARSKPAVRKPREAQGSKRAARSKPVPVHIPPAPGTVRR
jgi:hypoxanthine-DNA glycosylase